MSSNDHENLIEAPSENRTSKPSDKEARFNRKRFLQLGGAGIVGLVGGFGAYAYAQRAGVRRSVLSYGAKGDGSQDDGPAIRAALSDREVSEVEFPAASRGYQVNMSAPGWTPFPLRTGHKIHGGGAEGAIVRVGALAANVAGHDGRRLFATEDYYRGADDVSIRDLVIDGRRDDLDLKNEFDLVLTAFLIRSSRKQETPGTPTGVSGGFELSNCRVKDWPGVVLNAACLEDFEVRHNRVERPLRGGLIFNFWNRRGNVSDNEVHGAGDDAIAFNADGNELNGNSYHPQRAPASDVLVARNELSRVVRKPASFTQSLSIGPVLAIRGGTKLRVRDNKVLRGLEEAIVIERRPENHPLPARGITIEDNRLQRCPRGALTVAAEDVVGRAERNTAIDCGPNPYRNASADTFVIIT